MRNDYYQSFMTLQIFELCRLIASLTDSFLQNKENKEKNALLRFKCLYKRFNYTRMWYDYYVEVKNLARFKAYCMKVCV